MGYIVVILSHVGLYNHHLNQDSDSCIITKISLVLCFFSHTQYLSPMVPNPWKAHIFFSIPVKFCFESVIVIEPYTI